MTEHLVTWRIYVEARTPEEAARAALAAQRNVESDATCFVVRDETGRRTRVVCPCGHGPVSLAGDLAPIGRHLRLVKTSRA